MPNTPVRLLAAFGGVALAATALTASPAGSAPADGDVIPGAYIVTVADGASPDEVAADHGRRLGASVDHVYRHAARGYAARMSAGAAARAAADARVRSVVADRVVRISAKPGGGGGGSTSETVPTGVTRVGGGTKAGAAVAVLDTGIDVTHPDLNVSRVGINCSSGSSFSDGNGHGTHVAGTIGALRNGRGVVGVAPGTLVHPVRVLNNAGSGSWSSIICGINWVTGRASTIKVANMSLGGTGTAGQCEPGLHFAICESVKAGVTYVVAAGNENDDARNHVPAAYDEVITVSALADSDGVFNAGAGWGATCRVDQEDTLADFSNDGPAVDLIAPGVCIASTWKGGGYNTISGTSMASPHVAGLAALWVAAHPAATKPVDVKAGLLASAGSAGSDWNAEDDEDGIKEPLAHVEVLP
jgi:subtilisin family serine protease